jgi:hypothetical protein
MWGVVGHQPTPIAPVLLLYKIPPGPLTIAAPPPTPVPVADIESAVRTRPQSLPGLLAISVSGAAGSGTADEETAKDGPTGDETDEPDASGVPASERDAPSATEGTTAPPR